MNLVDLLNKLYKNVTVWIAEDPSKSEGIYFGAVRDIPLENFKEYEVVEIYPESYPAIGRFFGISIIVKRT